jgi:phosphoadenosine phosphosulfate reductase
MKLEQLQKEFAGLPAAEILALTARTFPGDVVFASSLGLEDQVITDMICRQNLDIQIFTLDTGRLFNESLDLLARTEAAYGIRIQVYFPDAAAVEKLVAERGINLFLESVENRRHCCGVRKVEPLRRALRGRAAWICGLRREQSPTRSGLEVIEDDQVNGLIKINPLLDWTEAQVREYAQDAQVPYNPLHDRGFASIGCACCTRAIPPGADPRSGRWWWESPEHKECGLHK